MATSTMTTTPSASTLHLPRILCLHGGGVTGLIFKIQLRSFLGHESLVSRFRFVFAEGPYLCDAGPGIKPVYSDYGPFRRWARWLPEQQEVEDRVGRQEILGACRKAMEEDDEMGATGDWVGVVGFSQGAKLAVSLLYEMQIEEDERWVREGDGTVVDEGEAEGVLVVNGKKAEWKFGIFMAGRAPLIALSESTEQFEWCQKAGGLPEHADLDAILERPEMKLRVPTVHVHGLKDEGLWLHQKLLNDYCAPGTTTLVEWDGPHRVPFKKADVTKVVDAIVEVVDEYGL